MTRKLLFSVHPHEFRIDTHYSGGPGGQNQNKRKTGVRITHMESGATGTSRRLRSQLANRRMALENLSKSKKFMQWVRLKAARIENGESIEDQVEEMMNPSNIKTEVRDANDRWIEVDDDYKWKEQ